MNYSSRQELNKLNEEISEAYREVNIKTRKHKELMEKRDWMVIDYILGNNLLAECDWILFHNNDSWRPVLHPAVNNSKLNNIKTMLEMRTPCWLYLDEDKSIKLDWSSTFGPDLIFKNINQCIKFTLKHKFNITVESVIPKIECHNKDIMLLKSLLPKEE